MSVPGSAQSLPSGGADLWGERGDWVGKTQGCARVSETKLHTRKKEREHSEEEREADELPDKNHSGEGRCRRLPLLKARVEAYTYAARHVESSM